MPGPHDALFKTTFGDPLHAAGVLRSALPAEVIALLDLSTLRRVVGTFVDDELAERESDVLFAVDTVGGQTVLVYVLLEHQSTVDSLMPLRVLRYEVRIWDAHVAAHGNALPLPPIVPIVVSHAEGGWTAATRFEEIIALDGRFAALAPFTPSFGFVLDDLMRASVEEVLRRPATLPGLVVLISLKHGRSDLLGTLEAMVDLLQRAASAAGGKRVVGAVLRYTLEVRDEPERTLRLADAIEDEEVKAMATSAAERWKRESFEKGHAQGQRAILVRQLTHRFGPLPARVSERIEAAGADTLARWADRVLDATTLEAVFDE